MRGSIDHKLILAVVVTEYRRFFGEPTFYIVALLRPYLWTLLLSEGLRHSLNSGNGQSFLGLLSYCIVFTGITSSFSLCWERHYGFLRLWFVYGLSKIDYVVGKLVFSCSLTLIVIILALPICLLINIPIDALSFLAALPDILLAIILVASIGLLVASIVHRLDLFGIIINFVLFPILFTSGAIYNLPADSILQKISVLNPFKWALEPLKLFFMNNYVLEAQLIYTRGAIVILSALFVIASVKFMQRDC